MKRLLIYVTCFLSLTGYAQEFEPKVGGHCYTLDVPDYMVKTYDLNDVATLQYWNVTKETYLIVIEDDKEQLRSLGMTFTDASDFLEYFIKDYYIDVEQRELTEIIEFENNGISFAQLELSIPDPEVDIFMLITSAESESHFYKILIWTVLEDKELYREDFLKIARTLNE